jgi:hypothetical protein
MAQRTSNEFLSKAKTKQTKQNPQSFKLEIFGVFPFHFFDSKMTFIL